MPWQCPNGCTLLYEAACMMSRNGQAPGTSRMHAGKEGAAAHQASRQVGLVTPGRCCGP